jgi:Uma2 family endonuclease
LAIPQSILGKPAVSIGPSISPTVSQWTTFVPRLFTVDEYHRLGEVGVLTEDDRVELLEGVITPKMMHNPRHDATLTLVEETLRKYLPSGWFIRLQSSMTTADSEPEPDVAIVKGAARDYLRRHPVAADVGLIAEVADSSLLRDRNKARIYARTGVPTYWIVNLVDAQIEAYSQPSGPCDQPCYRQSAVYRQGERIAMSLVGAEPCEIIVDELLP